MKILVINGPNLNMLGIREPEIYGKKTYNDLLKLIDKECKVLNIEVEYYQSNHEGYLVDKIQEAYNKEHGITPKTIIKEIPEEITIEQKKEKEEVLDLSVMTIREKKSYAQHIEQEMKKAAEQLDFEQAAELRDLLKEVQKEIGNK